MLATSFSIHKIRHVLINNTTTPTHTNHPPQPNTTPITITIWNANGIPPQLLPSSINLLPSSDIIILTETWLQPSPPSRATYQLPAWTQHHLYGQPDSHNYYHQGISVLVRKTALYQPQILPFEHHTQHRLTFRLDNYLIHCFYLPPSLTDEEAINIITNTPSHPDTLHNIYCGDFNARTTAFGDTRTTTRGSHLLQWMNSHHITCLNQLHAYGIPTYVQHHQHHTATSIIDLFLTDNPTLNSQPIIHSSLSLHSPHKAVSIELSFTRNNNKPFHHQHPRKMSNLSRLQEPSLKELLNYSLQKLLTPLQDKLTWLLQSPEANNPDIDQLTNQFNQSLYRAFDITIGRRKPKQKTHNWFWTDHLQQLVDQRERAYKALQQQPGTRRVDLLKKYKHYKTKLARAIGRRKAETWREFLTTLTQQPHPLTIQQIKSMRNKRRITPTYTSPHGPQAATNEMAQQLATVFDGSIRNTNLPPLDLPHINMFDPIHHPSPFAPPVVLTALKKLPNRKAPGPDHIKAEMLKTTASTITPILVLLFTICWQWSTIPNIWRQAQVIPIYKKGNPQDPANYRPISLTSHLRKLMEHCLSPLIEPNSPPTDISQGGFRHQRSALDRVTCLQQITQHHKHHISEPVLICLDIKSAYDTVDRQIIWQTLQTTCTPPLLHLLRQLFDHVSISVIISGIASSPFHPTTGVLQGSVLSPALYSIYINQLPTTLRLADQALNQVLHHLPPPLIPNTTLNSLLYADDIILIGTRDSIPTLLQVAERISFDLGFRWNPTKCVALSPPSSPPRIFHLYNTPIPHQPSFRYLGVPISNLGTINITELIAHNKQASLAALYSLVPIGFNSHGLNPALLTRLYKQFIRPTMEYGLAISQTTKQHITQLQQIQHLALRKMLGGHPTSEVAVAQKLTGLPTMHTRKNILQAKYIIRPNLLPPDALLTLLLPRLNAPRTRWSKLKYCRIWVRFT
ncbi:hypothetical protein INT47_006631 [Mucor saturninus]|uniref:Reverse transcriptase domain-containing protein n=1 Tax=Mucor saturninus TaxID=64648 RepID=A0A8H7UV81_9FUNG|nr:hypothetical protein INT47_006631 [Mucor saturninus]